MDKQEFIDECLREHNKYRTLHGVPPLRHSIHLDKTAQEWAEDLVAKESLQNSSVSSKGEVGENISMRKSTSTNVTLSGITIFCFNHVSQIYIVKYFHNVYQL